MRSSLMRGRAVARVIDPVAAAEDSVCVHIALHRVPLSERESLGY